MRTQIVIAFMLLILIMSPDVFAQDDITLPHYEGYISVAPGGRYFVDEAGQGFIVIGQNDGVDRPRLVTLLDRSSSESTEY